MYRLEKYHSDCSGTPIQKVLNPGGNNSYAELKIRGNQTISVWVYPRTSPWGQMNIYSKSLDGEGSVTIEPSGHVTYAYGPDGTGDSSSPFQSFTSSVAIPMDQWSHIAIVREFYSGSSTQGLLKWYINGALDDEVAAQYSTAGNSSNHVHVGSANSGKFFCGDMHELRVYNRALPADEIQWDLKAANSKWLNSAPQLPGRTPAAVVSGVLPSVTHCKCSVGEQCALSSADSSSEGPCGGLPYCKVDPGSCPDILVNPEDSSLVSCSPCAVSRPATQELASCCSSAPPYYSERWSWWLSRWSIPIYIFFSVFFSLFICLFLPLSASLFVYIWVLVFLIDQLLDHWMSRAQIPPYCTQDWYDSFCVEVASLAVQGICGVCKSCMDAGCPAWPEHVESVTQVDHVGWADRGGLACSAGAAVIATESTADGAMLLRPTDNTHKVGACRVCYRSDGARSHYCLSVGDQQWRCLGGSCR